MINHFLDDHPSAPQYTPPELPKRVHVRGVPGKKKTFLMIFKTRNLRFCSHMI